MAPSANRRRTILSLALAGSLAAAVALPALAATSTKFYTPSFSPTSPTSSSPGATVSYTFKILNNTTSTQQFGSANIIAPAGFALGSVGTPQTFNGDGSSAGKTWTSGKTGSTIMLRNPGPGPSNRLNPGQYVTVQFAATASCTTGNYSWDTRVKQSNDFSGTGNDFTQVGSDPVSTVAAGGGGVRAPSSVQFTVQPSDAQVNESIAPAVQVTVNDFCNAPEPDVAVTMSLGTNPGAAGTLAGTLSQTTNGSGVATFDDLSIDKSSSGYKLKATAGSLTTTSDAFDITSASVGCNGGDCHTSATSGTSTVTVNADGGTGTLSITFESVPLGCPDFGTNQAVGGTVTIDPPQGSPPPPSITVTFDDTINTYPPFQDSYPVCKTVESETGTTTEIVPFCDATPVPPCITEQTISFHGGGQKPTLHTVMLITQTDPRTLH
ncbi:MAG: hypothetical protein M3P11_13090 [Actinomycetota bacterium]|nr:hypothetical protein [Actinomycetota bacterium]